MSALICVSIVNVISANETNSNRREASPSFMEGRKPRFREVINVLDFSEDIDQEPDSNGSFSHASLTRDTMPLSFTICTAFLVEAWTTEFSVATLLHFNGRDGSRWGLLSLTTDAAYTQYGIKFGEEQFVAYSSRIVFPLQWVHLCLSLHTGTGMVGLVVDGQVVVEEARDGLGRDPNSPNSLSLVVGFTWDGYKFKAEYTGRWANINMFSSALSLDKLVAMTTAGGKKCGEPGSFLSWEEAEWTLHSAARMVEVEASEGPCLRRNRMDLYTADFGLHSTCMEHCQKVGSGRAPPVGTLKQMMSVTREVEAITQDISVLPWFWLAATDRQVEGQWSDFYTGEALGQYKMPWYPGHDTKYAEEHNCLVYFTDVPETKVLGEIECQNYNKGCLCQYHQSAFLRLRGLCPFSPLDRLFTPRQLSTSPNNLILLGLKSTKIQLNDYNSTTSLWTMTDAKTQVTAVSKASKVSYVLGKHTWTISNDVYDCGESRTYTSQLKLSGCDKDGEFTCDDGQCVRMEQRCDQLPDCRDKSDERGCQLLVLEEGYNIKVPPITAASSTNNTIVPVHVNISIILMKIVAIAETEHSIRFQFEIILEWKDNRATFHNLKYDTSLNAPTDDDIHHLWLPLVIFDNTDQKETTRLGERWEWSTSVMVHREGNFTRSSEHIVDEIEMFSGEENRLSMQQTYTHQFQCLYKLSRYPFDTQECTIKMNTRIIDINTVTLVVQVVPNHL